MVNKHKLVDYILLALFTISFLSSLGLSLDVSSKFCLTSTCDIVSSSSYSSTLGIKNSYWGIAVFALLSILTLWHILEPHHHKNKLIRTGVVIGSIISMYFIFLQVFIIRAFCSYCLIVDISMILALILLFLEWRYGHGWKGS